MSRKAGPVSFTSKGMFDVLGVDVEGGDEAEEEERMPEIQNVSSSPAPLSKAARKRLAKLSAKSSDAVSLTAGSHKENNAAVVESIVGKEQAANATGDHEPTEADALPRSKDISASQNINGAADNVAETASVAAGRGKIPMSNGRMESLVTSISRTVADAAGQAKDTATWKRVDEAASTISTSVTNVAGQAEQSAATGANNVANTMSQMMTMDHSKEGASGPTDHVISSAANRGTHAQYPATKMGNGLADSIREVETGVVEPALREIPIPAVGTERTPKGPGPETIESVRVESEDLLDRALEAIPSISTLIGTPTPATQQPQTSAPQKSSTTKSTFAPSLPESLPQPTANALPANRKRKTPLDFTPSGPGEASTLASPSKIGVKFEDGVAPGEGSDGEKTIAAKSSGLSGLKKDRNMIERTIWTFIMIAAFIGLLSLGHPYVILLVMCCQMVVYKEVTALFDLRDNGTQQVGPEQGDTWSKTLNWYFFVVTNYFLYGESIIYYFKHIVFVDAFFIPFARNHRFISFMLYVVGFVGFVSNLQRQYLRQQFALFCWVHISLLLIVVSSHFIVNNILEGLVWFFVPASLVICNDVMAYVCGKAFGRTPLIKLSPKKTVEGFVGAFICTLAFGLVWGTFFMRFPYMICPARDLGTNILSTVSCRPNPVFLWREFQFTGPAKHLLQTMLGYSPPTISYAPFQIHCLVMATFASLVAPFGGFFASGFKRAFNIKDFGHSIPGHGGMTDRMDCQFMMGLFSYVYYSSLIRMQYVTVGSIMQTVVTSLNTAEQLDLLSDLKRFLEGQGVRIQ